MSAEHWELAHQYGQGCRVLIDRASLEISGAAVKAIVRHELVPPAIDKRNQKPASRIQFANEYDTDRGLSRAHRLIFLYDDGTVSEPLLLASEWTRAEKGSLAELNCIKKLVTPEDRALHRVKWVDALLSALGYRAWK